MHMTKKEIYERVVRLTTELSQTHIPEKIFNAAIEGDYKKVDAIIDAFPEYYPNLYQEIINFGDEFNKLVGDSPEDNARMKKVLQDSETMMYALGRTKIIDRIAEAEEQENPQKLMEVIKEFKKDYEGLSENILKFQKESNEFWDKPTTGNEGAIFGIETDEENGVFEFNTNIIDARSFYTFVIMAHISDIYFYDDVEYCDEDGNICHSPANDQFVDAIEAVTNEAFAEFVSSYNIVDWIGKDEEYQTVGQILVAALADEFDDYVEDE